MSTLDVQTLLNVQTLKSNTANTPPVFQDGNGTEMGKLCRAWVKLDSDTTPTVLAGFNVSSITYLATGSWRVNFTQPMPSNNFSGFVTPDGNYGITLGITSQLTTSVTIYCKIGTGAGYNPTYLYAAFFA